MEEKKVYKKFAIGPVTIDYLEIEGRQVTNKLTDKELKELHEFSCCDDTRIGDLIERILDEHAEMKAKIGADAKTVHDALEQHVILNAKLAAAEQERDELRADVDEFRTALAVATSSMIHDEPAFDGTPNAHPAFWRGWEQCIERIESKADSTAASSRCWTKGILELVARQLRDFIPKKDGE